MVASAALISLGLKKEEPSWQGEMCALCPKLTYQQRMYGFIGCSGLGYVLSFLSTLFLFGGFDDDSLRAFIFLYTLGTCVTLVSALFFWSPKYMCGKMWHKSRRWCTALYMLLLLAVLVLAVIPPPNVTPPPLIILVLLLQISVGVWYGASFIPFGRKTIIKCCVFWGPCTSASCKPVERYLV